MNVVESERLALRKLRLEDADFILGLLNQPSFLRYIGDKGVRDLDGARKYLAEGPIASYAEHGYGLWLVRRKDGGAPVWICGLIRRPVLDDVDVGFALVPEFWRRGYATEAAAAVLNHAREVLGLSRVVAVTQPDNLGSIKTLEKLGMNLEKTVRLSEDDIDLELFATPDGWGERR